MKKIRSNYLFLIENSPLLFISLMLIMSGLLWYVWISHKEVADWSNRIENSTRLSVLAFLMSEENYHTQLELYELYSAPNQERFDDFLVHEAELMARLNRTYDAFSARKDLVSPLSMAKLEKLRSAMPEIRKHWHLILKGIEEKKSEKELRALLVSSEERFDNLQFNEEIRDIVEAQAANVAQMELRVQQIGFQHKLVLLLGIFMALCLSGLVTLLHRAALKGKINQIQLIQASKLASLGELSSGVAHELNNPLMFVKGYNGRIKASLEKENLDLNSPVWDYIQEVDSGVERMRKIVQHFKDFSRLSTQEMKPVYINEVLKSSFVLFEEQLRLNNIEIHFDLSKEDLVINGNSNRLEQVFLNLINNAKDVFVSNKSIKSKNITVRTKLHANSVIVEFEDNGTGISQDYISRVFDPFFTTKPVGQGTGLGLSISQGIILDHNGKIEVKSILDQGAKFIITFQAEMQQDKKSA